MGNVIKTGKVLSKGECTADLDRAAHVIAHGIAHAQGSRWAYPFVATADSNVM